MVVQEGANTILAEAAPGVRGSLPPDVNVGMDGWWGIALNGGMKK